MSNNFNIRELPSHIMACEVKIAGEKSHCQS